VHDDQETVALEPADRKAPGQTGPRSARERRDHPGRAHRHPVLADEVPARIRADVALGPGLLAWRPPPRPHEQRREEQHGQADDGVLRQDRHYDPGDRHGQDARDFPQPWRVFVGRRRDQGHVLALGEGVRRLDRAGLGRRGARRRGGGRGHPPPYIREDALRVRKRGPRGRHRGALADPEPQPGLFQPRVRHRGPRQEAPSPRPLPREPRGAQHPLLRASDAHPLGEALPDGRPDRAPDPDRQQRRRDRPDAERGREGPSGATERERRSQRVRGAHERQRHQPLPEPARVDGGDVVGLGQLERDDVLHLSAG
jgi:hypothetical protein